jgi:hypothetical protein
MEWMEALVVCRHYAEHIKDLGDTPMKLLAHGTFTCLSNALCPPLVRYIIRKVVM